MSNKPTFETFDPNQPDETNVWGVYDDYVFKTKSARPAALNALKACHRGKLYELVNGTWILRATKDPVDISNGHCDLCGVNLVQRASRRIYDYTNHCYGTQLGGLFIDAYWDWKRESGKIVSPPSMIKMCTTCYRGYA